MLLLIQYYSTASAPEENSCWARYNNPAAVPPVEMDKPTNDKPTNAETAVTTRIPVRIAHAFVSVWSLSFRKIPFYAIIRHRKRPLLEQEPSQNR